MKKEKGWVFCYDTKALPQNMTMKQMKDKIKEENIAYYDSSFGNKPQAVNLGGDNNSHIKDYVIVDVYGK